LFGHDPIGIAFDNENSDEYDAEVGTILPRLACCHSPTDVRQLVFEEFCKWFTPEVAGAEANYDVIAKELWSLWSKNERADLA
jgi:hypothetical protein